MSVGVGDINSRRFMHAPVESLITVIVGHIDVFESAL